MQYDAKENNNLKNAKIFKIYENHRHTRCLQIIFFQGREFLDNNVRIFKFEADCLEMINFTSSFRAKKIHDK